MTTDQKTGKTNMTADDFIGDEEAAALFGISRNTLRHHCMRSFVCRPGTIDVRLACPVVVGRKRRWFKPHIFALMEGAMKYR